MQTTAETNSTRDLNNNDLTSSRDFVQLIQESIVKHWNEEALTDYKGDTLRYKDVARKIEKIHIFFEQTGIKKGDKVALCGRNCAHWAVAYIATLTYGAVCVPILHEFKPDQVEDLVNHSEARLLFVGDYIWPQLNAEAMPDIEGIIGILDFQLLLSRSEKLTYAREHLNELYGKKYPKFFRAEHVKYRTSEPEELALINYTSGTTSNSKGVMVPYRAMWSNYHFALEVLEPYMPKEGARLVSILPMAHMYGMAFEFLYGFLRGTHLYFLTRVPSPKIIFQAFGEIKPHLIICVPLVLEKVIKNMILPKLQTPSMKILLGL
ncbi:MAG: AMP-binding protein, partial [Bacteroidaceae bacterium]|nr:AMP-binding protein [Bacteroidaceae bacterium]